MIKANLNEGWLFGLEAFNCFGAVYYLISLHCRNQAFHNGLASELFSLFLFAQLFGL